MNPKEYSHLRNSNMEMSYISECHHPVYESCSTLQTSKTDYCCNRLWRYDPSTESSSLAKPQDKISFE